MPGWCEDADKKDQNAGVVSLKGQSFEQCLEECKKQTGVTGCEFHPPKKLCAAHTKDVARGSGSKDYFCFVLPKQGLWVSWLHLLKYLEVQLVLLQLINKTIMNSFKIITSVP